MARRSMGTDRYKKTLADEFSYKLRPVLKKHKDYFGTHLIILNYGQMSRTTPEPAPSSPSFRTTLSGGHLTPAVRFSSHQAHRHDSSSVECVFEPGTLRPQDLHLTTRPLRP
ncbi:hypothetical protein AVEN_243670-1 [Araneus ventricosus]|uniref:Uncharacterized protein n=1 Tax=Araneus ventricosus TaxID=182803 RepID=A0A4Y2A4N2_ARAVE|nr:hypothetical protein AVEN_243670-1 [Araneus ventricosus]